MQYSNNCITVYIHTYIYALLVYKVLLTEGIVRWTVLHDKQFTNSHLESQFSMLKSLARHVGIKNTEVLGTHRCNWSQNMVIIIPECSHAQSCDHRQSNHPLFNVCLFNLPVVQLAKALWSQQWPCILNLNPIRKGWGHYTFFSKWYAGLKAKIWYSPTIKSLFDNQAVKQQNNVQNLLTSGIAMSSKQVANTPCQWLVTLYKCSC